MLDAKCVTDRRKEDRRWNNSGIILDLHLHKIQRDIQRYTDRYPRYEYYIILTYTTYRQIQMGTLGTSTNLLTPMLDRQIQTDTY